MVGRYETVGTCVKVGAEVAEVGEVAQDIQKVIKTISKSARTGFD
jgi:hypothetical protein